MAVCARLVEVGRRQFLKGGGAVAAGAALVGHAAPARAAPALARVDYPSMRLANLADLTVDEPLPIAYPDADSPGVLLKLGAPAEGGVGPDGDVVAFSILCPHKGFPLSYAAADKSLNWAGDRSFNCPGHYSRFDPEAGGQQIWGQATQNLPQYTLRVDDQGDIYAEGVDELIYGRLSNVLAG
jgi:arsenite oxidase small subunit